MEAAETIMAADASKADDYATTVNECVMSIFEACSFQDITGQRISKVVETLSVIEQRLHRIGEVWGVQAEEVRKTSEDDPGMAGPALAGEGIDQDDVDALLSGSPETAPAAEMSAQDLADDLFDQADVAEEETAAEDEAEEEQPIAKHAVSNRPETNLSDEDVDRLMGAEGPANDSEPEEADDRTPEQLVRAVESLLAEEADEDAEMAIGKKKTALKKAEEFSILDATNDDEDFAKEEPKQPKKAAAGGSKGKSTTQADIDALFS